LSSGKIQHLFDHREWGDFLLLVGRKVRKGRTPQERQKEKKKKMKKKPGVQPYVARAFFPDKRKMRGPVREKGGGGWGFVAFTIGEARE